MADVPTFAVVPTFGRPCFADCMHSIIPQVDHSFVIRTAPFEFATGAKVTVIDDYVQPKNISRWWNLGIMAAQHEARDVLGVSAWNVLVVNDDVIAPLQLTRRLTQAMRHRMIFGDYEPALRARNPVIAYPDNFEGDRFAFHDKPGPVEITTRMSGWCFMIRGESGITCDETFEWWYGDDDLDWTARQMGGTVMVPNCPVQHLYPTKTTAESAELTARTHVDRVLFERKWSGVPH